MITDSVEPHKVASGVCTVCVWRRRLPHTSGVVIWVKSSTWYGYYVFNSPATPKPYSRYLPKYLYYVLTGQRRFHQNGVLVENGLCYVGMDSSGMHRPVAYYCTEGGTYSMYSLLAILLLLTDRKPASSELNMSSFMFEDIRLYSSRACMQRPGTAVAEPLWDVIPEISRAHCKL